MSQIFMVPGTYDENLAHVEPGDVASRNYAAGEFLTWKGVLHSAKTAISTGETFVEDTNVHDESEGGLANALGSKFPRLELDIENTQITSLTQADVDWIAPDDGYAVLQLNSTGGHWGYIGRYKSDNTMMMLATNSTSTGGWSVSCSTYVKKGVKYRFSSGLDGSIYERKIFFYPFV